MAASTATIAVRIDPQCLADIELLTAAVHQCEAGEFRGTDAQQSLLAELAGEVLESSSDSIRGCFEIEGEVLPAVGADGLVARLKFAPRFRELLAALRAGDGECRHAEAP